MTYKEEKERFEGIIDEAAVALDNRRQKDAMAGRFPALYLYYAPGSEGCFGGICFAEDPMEPFVELGCGDRVPFDLQYGDATRQWIAERAGRLPLYPT